MDRRCKLSTLKKIVMNKVAIDVNVFGPLVKDIIVYNLCWTEALSFLSFPLLELSIKYLFSKNKKHPHSEEINATTKNSNVISIIVLYFAIVLEMQKYLSSCYTKASELPSIKHKPIVDK